MLSFLMTRQGATVAAIVCAVVVGVAWINGKIQAAEARGQAELLAEQSEIEFQAILDSVNGSWAEREQVWDSTHTALQDDLDRQKGAVRVARENASEAVLAARTRITALSDSLESLTAADLATIGAGLDSLEEANRLCNQALGACEDLVESADARIWDLETQQRQSLALVRQQALTINRLQDLGRPTMGTGGYVVAGIAVAEGIFILLQALSGG